MKFGVKIFKEEKFLHYFKDKADFFEVMALENYDYNFLKKYSKLIIVHAMHESLGVNLANPSKLRQNKQKINQALNVAKIANAKKIITHPGTIKSKNCSEENSINFYKELNNDKILIENCPEGICSTPEKTKEFMEKTNTKLCLDFNHAIETAIKLNKDYLDMIKEFVKLKPSHYHIGGQTIKPAEDHLELKKSQINLKEILRLIPRDSEITLETEPEIKKIENDLNLIRKIENDNSNKT